MSSLDNEPMNSSGTPNPGPSPAMSRPDTSRSSLMQRFMKDKILVGLIIVGLLTIFVGVAFTGEDTKKGEPAQPLPPGAQMPQTAGQAPLATPQQPQGAGSPAAATPAVNGGLTPQLATQFVSWWLSKSMDYGIQTAQASHKEAFDWMTPNTVEAFRTGYWTPDIEQAVVTGKVTAAFQPASVQAQFLNPDGSIVVGMNGSLVMQSAGTSPATQQLAADFLVKQESGGLRIVGINIHPAPPSGLP
ncbi:MAG TPA: hypothetical protein V6C76_15460 [Drouetiella sp.]